MQVWLADIIWRVRLVREAAFVQNRPGTSRGSSSMCSHCIASAGRRVCSEGRAGDVSPASMAITLPERGRGDIGAYTQCHNVEDTISQEKEDELPVSEFRPSSPPSGNMSEECDSMHRPAGVSVCDN